MSMITVMPLMYLMSLILRFLLLSVYDVHGGLDDGDARDALLSMMAAHYEVMITAMATVIFVMALILTLCSP